MNRSSVDVYMARNSLHNVSETYMNDNIMFLHFTTVPSGNKYLHFIYSIVCKLELLTYLYNP